MSDRLSTLQEASSDERNRPAVVNGSARSGVALFETDAIGDLVAITYLCAADAWADARADGALPWPAFDFGGYDACCGECGATINRTART